MHQELAGAPVAYLYVAERERAMRFYTETLGAGLKSADTFGDFLDVGGALLRMTVMPGHRASPHPVLGWNVPDIAAAAQGLAGRGVEFIRYEGMGQDDRGIWTSPDGKTKVAFFADPDGNVLSLSET